MKPQRTQRLPWREMDGRAIVIHPRKGEVHELNPAASWIWRQADGSRTIDELAEGLAADFDVAPDAAVEDVTEFVRALGERGLLEVP